MTEERHSKKSMYVSFELGQQEWKLTFGDGERKRNVRATPGDGEKLKQQIAVAKAKFGLPADCEVYSCYEAGRDGFWVHRFLESLGVKNAVVDSASIEVNRRKRRNKTDRLDAEKLLEMLIRARRYGEARVWREVRVPTEQEEDDRRMQRERGRLVKEHSGHVTRMRSLLALHGARTRRLTEHVESYRDWHGKPLKEHVREELKRESVRAALVEEQILAIDKQMAERLKDPKSPAEKKAAKMMQLKAVGQQTGCVLSFEFFGSRQFKNRRQVGALAGLTGSRYDSGKQQRELGISKAGSRWVRSICVELAWRWLRFQPQSELSLWFQRRFGGGGGRMRRIGIVALARRLLIALWRYVEQDVLPAGAILKGA